MLNFYPSTLIQWPTFQPYPSRPCLECLSKHPLKCHYWILFLCLLWKSIPDDQPLTVQNKFFSDPLLKHFSFVRVQECFLLCTVTLFLLHSCIGPAFSLFHSRENKANLFPQLRSSNPVNNLVNLLCTFSHTITPFL